MMMNAAEQAEEFAIAIWHKLQSWKVIHFSHLPQWLQDNDFLHFGHRPPLPTIECFKSIIRIHTETGNIWTHLLGNNRNLSNSERKNVRICHQNSASLQSREFIKFIKFLHDYNTKTNNNLCIH